DGRQGRRPGDARHRLTPRRRKADARPGAAAHSLWALRLEPLRAERREVERALPVDRLGTRVRRREELPARAAAELIALPAAVEVAEPALANEPGDLARVRPLGHAVDRAQCRDALLVGRRHREAA